MSGLADELRSAQYEILWLAQINAESAKHLIASELVHAATSVCEADLYLGRQFRAAYPELPDPPTFARGCVRRLVGSNGRADGSGIRRAALVLGSAVRRVALLRPTVETVANSLSYDEMIQQYRIQLTTTRIEPVATMIAREVDLLEGALAVLEAELERLV